MGLTFLDCLLCLCDYVEHIGRLLVIIQSKMHISDLRRRSTRRLASSQPDPCRVIVSKTSPSVSQSQNRTARHHFELRTGRGRLGKRNIMYGKKNQVLKTNRLLQRSICLASLRMAIL